MSRPLRLAFPGSVWHIKARFAGAGHLFRDDVDRRRFVDLLAKAVERFKWTLTSYVLMPRYYRLSVELTEAATLSKGVKWVNACYAQRFDRRHDRVGVVIQTRFEGIILEKNLYLPRVVRDVVLDPVRAGLCPSPGEYPWSSYRAAADPMKAPAWLTPPTSPAEFVRFVDADANDNPFSELQHDIFLGSESWIRSLRAIISAGVHGVGTPRKHLMAGLPNMDRVVDAVSASLCLDRADLLRPRGGRSRMVAAWIGFHAGKLTKRAIATGLGLRSGCSALDLIQKCDRELETDRRLAMAIELCLDTIGRPKPQGED